MACKTRAEGCQMQSSGRYFLRHRGGSIFFHTAIISWWNSLPWDASGAETIHQFKKQLGKLMGQQSMEGCYSCCCRCSLWLRKSLGCRAMGFGGLRQAPPNLPPVAPMGQSCGTAVVCLLFPGLTMPDWKYSFVKIFCQK